jgi:hypothetical protein
MGWMSRKPTSNDPEIVDEISQKLSNPTPLNQTEAEEKARREREKPRSYGASGDADWDSE